jgi:hypothetical protein
MENMYHLIIGAFVAQMVGVIVTVAGGYKLLAWRIAQQEEIMRTVLNNGIRSDIRTLDEKVDRYTREMVRLKATCDERHHARREG